MKNYKYLLIAVVCMAIGASCHKTINVPKNTNPIDSVQVDSFRISSVTYTAVNNTKQRYRLTYNSDNSVDSLITNDTIVTRFYYYTGYYKKVTYQVGSSLAFNTQTINTNNQGNVTATSGSNSESFIYNASQQVIDLIVAVDTFTYHWDGNGNFDTLFAPGPVLYGYDLSKKGQPGDMENIENFLLYGKILVKTNNLHLLKTFPGSGDTARYTYTYDNSGRVVNASQSGVTGGYSYTYY